MAITGRPLPEEPHPLGVDLEKIAAGSGIKRAALVETTAELAHGARLLREGNGTAFVLLRVQPTEPPSFKRDLDPVRCRVRFKMALAAASLKAAAP